MEVDPPTVARAQRARFALNFPDGRRRMVEFLQLDVLPPLYTT